MGLTYSQNGMMIEDWFDKIQLNHNGDEHTGYYYIQIDDLAQGDYKLNFVSGHESKEFKIQVHKGTQWGQDGFILKKNCL